jgi:hypothetical protein
MTTAELTTIPAEIDRDRYGRPMVIPPGGGKKVAYTRCTTFVDALEDKYNLQKWQQRMVILGLVDRPDLLLSAAAHRDDKRQLDKVADDAVEAAKAHANATIGTAIHALTHRIDRGEDIGPVPGEYQRDLDAYTRATADLEVLHAETFTVHDGYRIGGTPDRVVRRQGRNYIADIKTGSIEWGAGKIAMQLAVYSRSSMYEHRTGNRAPLPDIDQDRGIVIHLPAGTGECSLHWVDIAAGWEAVGLAAKVRDWRSRKGLLEPLSTPSTQPGGLSHNIVTLNVDPILTALEQAATVAELEATFLAHQSEWTDSHTAAASARKRLLAQTA